jgi:hypothetical protein
MKYALIVLVLLAGVAHAAPDKATSPAAAKNKDMNFEDLLVSGQYHFSDEAVTTVEEDKVLNSLIGVRADFKDRMKQSATLGEVKTK